MEKLYSIQLLPTGRKIAVFTNREEAEIYSETFNNVVKQGTAKASVAIKVISVMATQSNL